MGWAASDKMGAWRVEPLSLGRCMRGADLAVGPQAGGDEGQGEADAETRRAGRELRLRLAACESEELERPGVGLVEEDEAGGCVSPAGEDE